MNGMVQFLKEHPAALVALGGSLAAIGAMGANLPDWHAAASPGFVFAALAQFGSTIVGVFGKTPTLPKSDA